MRDTEKAVARFTFQYVSIKTIINRDGCKFEFEFTFQYVSIKTLFNL